MMRIIKCEVLLMRVWFTLSLAVSIAFTVSACGHGKPESMKLGNGSFSVTTPGEVSFGCQILQHASDCNNYNVPGSIEGMEVRVCQGESKHTTFLTVTGKHPTGPQASQDANTPEGFAAGWSKCKEGKIKSSEPVEIGGKTGEDFVLSTPLGDGASRVYVDKEYSVMVLAVPKHDRSSDEISGFVTSLRPVTEK